MDLIKRYVPVQGIKTTGNELIPIWDDRIQYINDDGNSGNYVRFEGHRYHTITNFIYDLKKKICVGGIELDFYPTQTAYIKDEIILYEVKSSYLTERKIVDIKFERFDLSILKGTKIDKYYKAYFNDIAIESDSLYSLKTYHPTYVLDDGTEVIYEHQLNHKL